MASAERWAFQPYDFSEALPAASRAYDSRGPRVREALDRVRGDIPDDGSGPPQPKTVEVYPAARACWVVLDEATRDARRVCHERGESGHGYRRPFSAELVVALAEPALRAGLRVLAVTPYRAQAALLHLVDGALRQRLGRRAALMLQRVTLMHMTGTGSFAPESFDAVFVDEAQDLGAAELAHLYSLARPLARGEGPPHKAFLLSAWSATSRPTP